MNAPVTGTGVLRQEDRRLVTGTASFVDDLDLDALQIAFVRSEYAHAKIIDIEVAGALEVNGVVAVYTYEDLEGTGGATPLMQTWPHPAVEHIRLPTPLARDEVNYVGHPIALVVATDRYVAEDAVAAITVEYEALPAAVDLARAVAGEEGPAHADMDGNVYATVSEERGDVEAALSSAPHVFHYDLSLERSSGSPLECRAVAAQFDPPAGRLRVWDTTQIPLLLPGILAASLWLDPEDIEVIAPDIGGGFGTKVFQPYPEEVLIPWVAHRLGRAVKWTEDRSEHFVASSHARCQLIHVDVGVDSEGVLQALDVKYAHDGGAFCQFGVMMPNITATMLSGQYSIPNLRYEYRAVYTNTTQTSPYRGSGQPYAIFTIERVMDLVARELGISRPEIRRRNFIRPEQFPYEVGFSFPTGGTVSYDSGNYAPALEKALEDIGYSTLEEEREAAAAEGRSIGFGIACYIENSGTGPFEGAKVNVLPNGAVTVAVGSTDCGQGHKTAFAQLVADELSVPMDRISVVGGDSRRLQYGMGTFASRSATVGGSAVVTAARSVADKAKRLAAGMLQVAPEALELADGVVRIKGVPEAAVPLADLAMAALFLPPQEGDSPGLTATEHWVPRSTSYSSGVHAAVVEVDRETFDLRVLRYAIVHDCGKVINPLLVKAQVLGGFAHGFADAFFEQRRYDKTGQPINTTFMDYVMPFATEIPPVTLAHFETPAPMNPIGVKGSGEGGTIPVPALVASAIEDALNVEIYSMPQSPLTLYEMTHSQDAKLEEDV